MKRDAASSRNLKRTILAVTVASLALGCAGRASAPVCSRRLPEPGEIVGVCGFVNPEDLEAVPGAAAVLTAEFRRGGAISAFELTDRTVPRPVTLWPTADPAGTPERRGDPECVGPPGAADFHPHGIAALPVGADRHLVAVVDHGTELATERDTVQLFFLEGRWPGLRMRWVGCIRYPARVLANDVALLPGPEIYATNFASGPGLRTQIRSLLGIDTGDILRWTPAGGWSHVPGTRSPTPNGIALSPDGASVIFADNGNRRVAWFERQFDGPRPTVVSAGVGGRPDNINVSVDGRVTTVTTNLRGAFPYTCDFDAPRCAVGFDVWEIDLENRVSARILRHDGSMVGSATSALAVGEIVLIGTQLDARLGIWRPPKP